MQYFNNVASFQIDYILNGCFKSMFKIAHSIEAVLLLHILWKTQQLWNEKREQLICWVERTFKTKWLKFWYIDSGTRFLSFSCKHFCFSIPFQFNWHFLCNTSRCSDFASFHCMCTFSTIRLCTKIEWRMPKMDFTLFPPEKRKCSELWWLLFVINIGTTIFSTCSML